MGWWTTGSTIEFTTRVTRGKITAAMLAGELKVLSGMSAKTMLEKLSHAGVNR